ncbi:MAG: Fe-S cluster assembly ATPase SufC [Patescibacteria group bacterium]
MLSVKNLTVNADEKEILHDISASFDVNKIYAIMGINGSGKSSFANTLIGNPSFTLANGTIKLDKKDITKLPPNKRAEKGLFFSPQSPLAISGVTVGQLLRSAIPRDKTDSKTLSKQIKETAKELKMPNELLSRSLNENFSGGERKKMEILQMAILDPKYIILDEIDTGVDVDALKIIATFLKNFTKNTDKTLILITHYNRILTNLPVDKIFVMKDGKITQEGDATLAEKIEKSGYEK